MAIVLGQLAEAWVNAWKRQRTRELHQITRLSDWKRRRNGRWVNDVSYTDAHPRRQDFYSRFFDLFIPDNPESSRF